MIHHMFSTDGKEFRQKCVGGLLFVVVVGGT